MKSQRHTVFFFFFFFPSYFLKGRWLDLVFSKHIGRLHIESRQTDNAVTGFAALEYLKVSFGLFEKKKEKKGSEENFVCEELHSRTASGLYL
jgi:hypothetical protein